MLVIDQLPPVVGLWGGVGHQVPMLLVAGKGLAGREAGGRRDWGGLSTMLVSTTQLKNAALHLLPSFFFSSFPSFTFP